MVWQTQSIAETPESHIPSVSAPSWKDRRLVPALVLLDYFDFKLLHLYSI